MGTVFQNILFNEREAFLKSGVHLDPHELKSLNYMSHCGTEKFGFNAYECPDCGHKVIHYNSCGDRHCPSCQAKKREDWIERMESFLLDIPYFHIVFTVPDSLNELFIHNRNVMYSLLFRTSAQTLLKTCREKYGQIGFASILHTWGSTLVYHPHIHMIVSGGGISTDENGNEVFVHAKNNFLISVRILSEVFRGKFMDALKKAKLIDKQGKDIDLLAEPYRSLVNELYAKDWVVYAKTPFGNNQAVLNYIGRYSHRVAISNARITEYDEENHKVTFRYKDYRDRNHANTVQKEMTLDATEFIRRFMLHILPPRCIKIRYYGFMSNSNRRESLPKLRLMLDMPPMVKKEKGLPTQHLCPECSGFMTLVSTKKFQKSEFECNSS